MSRLVHSIYPCTQILYIYIYGIQQEREAKENNGIYIYIVTFICVIIGIMVRHIYRKVGGLHGQHIQSRRKSNEKKKKKREMIVQT